MPQVVSWGEEDWSRELKQRLDRAMKFREAFEAQWQENMSVVMNATGRNNPRVSVSFDNILELDSGEVDSGDSQVGMNEVFKYVRFWHSQMSANPPSVIVRPSSTDPSDRRKADAADRTARFLRKDKNMGEVQDEANLNVLITGTGYTKVVWDEEKGDIFDFNEETSEVKMEGDHCIYAPRTTDVWLDPDARRKGDVRWTIERLQMTLEEAKFKFPLYKDKLEELVTDKASNTYSSFFGVDSPADSSELVEIMEYYEKGMPINGGVGRHAYFLADGTVLKYGKNNHYKSRLPIKVLTYIDVPGQVYGKSVVDYTARLQVMLNSADTCTLDALQAHNVVRMVIPETVEIEDEAIGNSHWDWIKTGGNGDIRFVPPAQLMPDSWRFRDALVAAIRDLFGINDSMMGIQRREQSAVSQQTAIESGTMIHRRLMTKYAQQVEEVYQDALGIVKTRWTVPRHVLVLGEEKAFEAADFAGADIAGGFDLDVEYGTSLPVDPNMAREQLMLLMPALKEAGLSMKQILRRFKLNEVESTLDIMELAADRQREIFEEMIARATKGEAVYIAPRELEEHQGMLEYATEYRMTAEFKYLDADIQALIERHIKERIEMAAQAATGQPEGGPGVLALPGSPGVSGAMTPEMGAVPAPPPEEEIM